MYARDRGANAPTQQIRQRLGGIVDVDTKPGQSVRDAFGIIELPKTPPEAFTVLQAASQSAQSTTGADEAFTQGSLPGKGGSSAARTATGAGGIIAANAGKIQGPVGHFVKATSWAMPLNSTRKTSTKAKTATNAWPGRTWSPRKPWRRPCR